MSLKILIVILSHLHTKDLLPYAAVSRHFYSIVTRAVHRRVLDAATLPRNELILECYHPSAKISTPYLSCQKLGTSTLDGKPMPDECERLPEIQRLYSSFRPVIIEDNRRSWRFRTLAIDPDTGDGVTQSSSTRPCPREDVFLDSGELFSQLCTVTNVVKEGPRHGLFVSHVNVSDGVIRVWREWLARRVSMSLEAQADEFGNEERVLWADREKHVGLHFQVTLGPSERMPLLSNLDDNEPISYTLEYKGKTLHCALALSNHTPDGGQNFWYGLHSSCWRRKRPRCRKSHTLVRPSSYRQSEVSSYHDSLSERGRLAIRNKETTAPVTQD
jgi:hypothetical protein